MRAGNIEMVNDITQKIAARENARARVGFQLELTHRLRGLGTRLHHHFHDALAHGFGIAESGGMADGIEHFGYRISDVG